MDTAIDILKLRDEPLTNELRTILCSRSYISREQANTLAARLGSTSEFWLRRNRDYVDRCGFQGK